MLTLSPGSVCDVCAEEYGPHCVPHSIPCGHVLCSSCCHKIVEKTLPRLQPVCPFCRDHFTSEDVRLIRIDFSASGWATRRRGGLTEALDIADRSAPRREDRFPFVEPGSSRTRAEARRLEDKVAKVAAKKCSVEEVSTLHNELQDWLTHDEKSNDQLNSSLSLSAALLRAILMNHFAHSEATKLAKGVEATLKGKLDDAESSVTKLEADLKQYQALHNQKVQECQALRAELSRFTLKSASSQATTSPVRPSTAAPTGLSERRQSVSSSAASTYNVPAMPSMLSRFAATHSRSTSASVSGGSRPTTPARMTTPSIRSETPTQASMLSASRLRATSPIPPSRPRTISVSASSPQKITRSHSDEQERERERIHERWMPSPNVAYSPPTGKTINYPPYFGSSAAPGRARSSFSTNAA
ncbi:uncharacterized protein F5891DRAFT_961739 [Suillus fuscotomentosus]|uniref:RING-type domain-containing protein n=1 Tax=Suillus fuscotomentosus TaxID=1912939 RepID=A0AAD4DUU0_9AGAM|nr:uncharacterized protein F5891DRAFT_961739 [Suillus fuscotomentosus]KAG1894338.1 hypothetical protein F5891DRAFT_961739 [Suillus fuscotomentosus]